MQLTLHTARRTPHSASHLVQAMSAWSVKTRRAQSPHCRDARVYGHATTAMHDNEYTAPIEYTLPRGFYLNAQAEDTPSGRREVEFSPLVDAVGRAWRAEDLHSQQHSLTGEEPKASPLVGDGSFETTLDT